VTLSQLKTVTGALYRIQRSLSNQSSAGNDARNSGSLSLRRNAANDDAALTSSGRAFQACAAATGNARSPSVERRVAGTTNVIELAERRRRDPIYLRLLLTFHSIHEPVLIVPFQRYCEMLAKNYEFF